MLVRSTFFGRSLSKRTIRTVFRTLQALMILIVSGLWFRGYADPLPSLIWSGDPIITSTNGTVFPEATDIGMRLDGGSFSATVGNSNMIEAKRSFVVTSSGLFRFSSSEDAGVDASNCDPLFCESSAFVKLSFTGFSGIGGSNVGGLYFSLSGSDSSPGTGAGVSLSETQSKVVSLSIGSYFLVEGYNASAQASGDNLLRSGIISSVVPVPEPQSYGIFLGSLFAPTLWWKLHRKRLKSNNKFGDPSPKPPFLQVR